MMPPLAIVDDGRNTRSQLRRRTDELTSLETARIDSSEAGGVVTSTSTPMSPCPDDHSREDRECSGIQLRSLRPHLTAAIPMAELGREQAKRISNGQPPRSPGLLGSDRVHRLPVNVPPRPPHQAAIGGQRPRGIVSPAVHRQSADMAAPPIRLGRAQQLSEVVHLQGQEGQRPQGQNALSASCLRTP